MLHSSSAFISNVSAVLWGVVLLLAAIEVVRFFWKRRSWEQSLSTAEPSVTQRRILTNSEARFFSVLREAVGSNYLLFAQVPLCTMIDIACENRSNATTWRNQIDRKRVDFALVHPTTFVTHAVIELDDRSHAHPDRKKRDAFVESLIKRAGIHLVRIPVTASYTPQFLRQQLGLEAELAHSA